MLQEALQKLQKEVADSPKDEYVRMLGAELINYVRANPDKAPLFVAQGKSIQGSLAAMRKAVEKKKQGNMAVVTPDEGKSIVLEYYGIQTAKAEPEPVAVGFSVDIDDLL
ncbi:hypothetical protein EBB07_00935 [Paenibacillaceae bacterium]|nr:hypothetical protein EBB07_00935 [Paenibacillaceae bacterium]